MCVGMLAPPAAIFGFVGGLKAFVGTFAESEKSGWTVPLGIASLLCAAFIYYAVRIHRAVGSTGGWETIGEDPGK